MRRGGFGGGGLTGLSTRELERLLARVHDGSLTCPITHPSLLRAGMPDLVDRVAHLSGLDASAARAVLVAVLAERRREEERSRG